MQHLRYVVLSQDESWNVIRGHRRLSQSYASKTQAMCAAIEFAERDSASGRRTEVVVRHEDGRFMTEWMFGRDTHAGEAARPLITPARH
jgi:Uncharacterized protein conserved in bacteria (DUF2188)